MTLTVETYIKRLPEFMGEDYAVLRKTTRGARKGKEVERPNGEITAEYLKDEARRASWKGAPDTDATGMLAVADDVTSPWPGGFWLYKVKDWSRRFNEPGPVLNVSGQPALEHNVAWLEKRLRQDGVDAFKRSRSVTPTHERPVEIVFIGWDDTYYRCFCEDRAAADSILALLATSPATRADLRDVGAVNDS